jgi:hypothetical protein
MCRQCQYRWQIAERWTWLLWWNFMGLEAFDAVVVESTGAHVTRGGGRRDAIAIPTPRFMEIGHDGAEAMRQRVGRQHNE